MSLWKGISLPVEFSNHLLQKWGVSLKSVGVLKTLPMNYLPMSIGYNIVAGDHPVFMRGLLKRLSKCSVEKPQNDQNQTRS